MTKRTKNLFLILCTTMCASFGGVALSGCSFTVSSGETSYEEPEKTVSIFSEKKNVYRLTGDYTLTEADVIATTGAALTNENNSLVFCNEITLDLNGYTLYNPNAIKEIKFISDGCKITVKNGKIDKNLELTFDAAFGAMSADSDINLENLSVNVLHVNASAELTMSNVKANSDRIGIEITQDVTLNADQACGEMIVLTSEKANLMVKTGLEKLYWLSSDQAKSYSAGFYANKIDKLINKYNYEIGPFEWTATSAEKYRLPLLTMEVREVRGEWLGDEQGASAEILGATARIDMLINKRPVIVYFGLDFANWLKDKTDVYCIDVETGARFTKYSREINTVAKKVLSEILDTKPGVMGIIKDKLDEVVDKLAQPVENAVDYVRALIAKIDKSYSDYKEKREKIEKILSAIGVLNDNGGINMEVVMPIGGAIFAYVLDSSMDIVTEGDYTSYTVNREKLNDRIEMLGSFTAIEFLEQNMGMEGIYDAFYSLLSMSLPNMRLEDFGSMIKMFGDVVDADTIYSTIDMLVERITGSPFDLKIYLKENGNMPVALLVANMVGLESEAEGRLFLANAMTEINRIATNTVNDLIKYYTKSEFVLSEYLHNVANKLLGSAYLEVVTDNNGGFSFYRYDETAGKELLVQTFDGDKKFTIRSGNITFTQSVLKVGAMTENEVSLKIKGETVQHTKTKVKDSDNKIWSFADNWMLSFEKDDELLACLFSEHFIEYDSGSVTVSFARQGLLGYHSYGVTFVNSGTENGVILRMTNKNGAQELAVLTRHIADDPATKENEKDKISIVRYTQDGYTYQIKYSDLKDTYYIACGKANSAMEDKFEAEYENTLTIGSHFRVIKNVVDLIKEIKAVFGKTPAVAV